MKKPKQKLSSIVGRWRRVSIMAVALVLGGSVLVAPVVVRADQYDQQIQQLQQQNSQTQGALDSLVGAAQNYQQAIDNLQAQISSLQVSINNNIAQQHKLKKQIADAEAQLAYQKKVLDKTLMTMYVDGGDMSTIEMLATSKDLSDFVDKQEYRNVVQQQVVDTMQKIDNLEKQLKKQETQVASLLKDQQAQQSRLNASKQKQANLLAYNQQQQAQYNDQLAANNSKINELRAAQRAAYARLSSSGSVTVLSAGNCGGGFPADATNSYGGHWGCNYGLDAGLDSWGMYNRECVSYAAWRVYQTFGYMPYWGGVGNAYQWPSDADAAGIPRGSTPRVHSVAIGTNPQWFSYLGHAMFVEAVSGDQVLVSQMNFSGPGTYSEMWIPTSLIDTFIYFGS